MKRSSRNMLVALGIVVAVHLILDNNVIGHAWEFVFPEYEITSSVELPFKILPYRKFGYIDGRLLEDCSSVYIEVDFYNMRGDLVRWTNARWGRTSRAGDVIRLRVNFLLRTLHPRLSEVKIIEAKCHKLF